MKKLLAVSFVCLSLTLLVPMMGCGGSGSSDSPSQPTEPVPSVDSGRSAVVITTDTGKAIRVSWLPPAASDSYVDTVVEYQIYRAPVTDGYVPPIESNVVYSGSSQFAPPVPINPNPRIRELPGYTLVGTVDGNTTTFVDTTQARTFIYHNIARSSTYNPDRLAAQENTEQGITPSRYAYDIHYVYLRPPFVDNLTGETLHLYGDKWFDNPIAPVRFD